MEDTTSHGASNPTGSTNGATNGSAHRPANGSHGGLTNGSASSTATANPAPSKPTDAFSFALPTDSTALPTHDTALPTYSTAAHSSGEDPSMPAATPTPSRESSRNLETRSRTVVRRDAMGVAAVRVAGRLTHTELLANQASPSSSHSSDPTIDLDELLTMLGSYLLSSGFEHPEIHAKLGGQSIVVNLVSPEISAT
ncbi:hypothetical protein CJ178_27810 [Rhodococcus sp. ACPA4]|jgi:hypothetical protein|uniref:Uncharacterized protein n=1 Tax=Rhodococcus globerulus TaxID=33008 RepID=A0ABU4BQ90_RHOGO|nr:MULTISPECIES: hypothetical protein [Rhodococcus]KJF21421.1 hypothetical protein SZ00_04629 [Rhodococcus sp. AD45]MDV6266231.1 hypothetical protein [Rhodococcus globerulus]PBC37839.1 hypothetical protein CJ178_27810 [Rhodococcus sp. ACPA4]PSR38907.1 hypothetical protein C7T36_28415 [Rhodococcus sp. AD45-ID]